MLNRIAGAFVRIMQRWMPDPFLFAVILTFLTYILALALTDVGPVDLLDHWYVGVFRLLKFAMQMILILVAGHALADAPVVKRLLDRLAGLPSTQSQAVVTVLLGAAAGSLLNWGFGLVVGAILARRVASRLKHADFAFLVAAAYSGFIVWESGLSSSIALVSAT
ncbi:MAG: short-chain fatty acid transporter, partial [Deltaproteobacteria bacterium]|nr:short-chain fatty acid transporter [Deltaproteobacteria bacterium]